MLAWAPAWPTKGLSAGTLPSPPMRMILPWPWARSCALTLSLAAWRSPSVMNKVSPGASTMRPPKWPLLATLGLCLKITRHWVSALPSALSTAEPTARPLRPGLGTGAWLGVAQVQAPAAGKVRRQHHVE